MRKIISCLLALTLLCVFSVFSGCTGLGSPNGPARLEPPNLKKNSPIRNSGFGHYRGSGHRR